MDTCCICNKPASDERLFVNLTQKGLGTIIRCINSRKREDIRSRLNAQSEHKVCVHSECRRNFTDASRSAEKNKSTLPITKTKKVRSDFKKIDWTNCFICGEAFQERHQRNRRRASITGEFISKSMNGNISNSLWMQLTGGGNSVPVSFNQQ